MKLVCYRTNNGASVTSSYLRRHKRHLARPTWLGSKFSEITCNKGCWRRLNVKLILLHNSFVQWWKRVSWFCYNATDSSSTKKKNPDFECWFSRRFPLGILAYHSCSLNLHFQLSCSEHIRRHIKLMGSMRIFASSAERVFFLIYQFLSFWRF